jgi:opacity protein-like surface antigen
LALALVVGILASVVPAGAQALGPAYELSAGYQFTHVPDENLPLGFAVDAARNWGTLGLLAEGGWARHSDEAFGIETSLNLWHVGVGPRLSSRRNPRVTPYAQVIAGIVHARTSLDILGVDTTISETDFMVQPGGGVSVMAGDGWAVFGSVDYRRVFLNENNVDDENDVRFLIGLRMVLD